MRGIFGRKVVKTAASIPAAPPQIEPKEPSWSAQINGKPIAVVVVKKSAAQDTNPGYVADAISGFLNVMLQRGGFGLGDLAEHTKALYQVDNYIGAVSNGGHGQYVENTGLPEPTIKFCQAGLRLIGQNPYSSIYDDLLDLCAAPAQVGNFVQGAFDATPKMKDLDKVFFASHYNDPLAGYVKRFALAQPWCHVVEDADFRPTMTWLFSKR